MFQRFHLLRLFLGSAPTSHFTAPSSPRETWPSHIYVGISQTNNDDLPAATRRRVKWWAAWWRVCASQWSPWLLLTSTSYLSLWSTISSFWPSLRSSIPLVFVCPCVCVLMVLQYLGILPPPIAPSCLVAISNRLIPSASSHFLLSNFTVSTAACGCRAWLLCTSSHWMLLKIKHMVSCCKC